MLRSYTSFALLVMGGFSVVFPPQQASAQGRPGLFDGIGAPPSAAVAADEQAYSRAAAAILADPAKRYDPAYNRFAADGHCFGGQRDLECSDQAEALANDPRKSLSCRLGLICADPPAIPGYTPYANLHFSQHRRSHEQGVHVTTKR